MGSFLDLTPLNFRISKRVLFSIEVKVVHFGQLLLLLLKQFSFFNGEVSNNSLGLNARHGNFFFRLTSHDFEENFSVMGV